MKAKVIGVRKSEKDGNISTSLFLGGIAFSDWEASSSTFVGGSKVDTAFVRKDIDCKPGDVVSLEYEKGFQDKAVLTDVIVLERALDKNAPKS